MGPRTELRQRFEAGDLDKHALSFEMREHNRALEDYADLLTRGEVASVTVRPSEILIESALAPVSFACDLDDAGAPPVVALAQGRYEAEEMRVLRALLGDASTFLDVGANVGWYALHAAALFEDLRVIACEPVPQTHAILARNVATNDLDVEVLNVAISDEEGELEIWASAAYSGAASAAPSRSYEGAKSVRCTKTTLDSTVSTRGLKVDVIKADVEGGELAVIRGGLETIDRDRPAIMLEMLRIHAAPFGYHPNDLIDLLAQRGYESYAVTEGNGIVPFDRMDDSTVETNFLFVQPDRHGEAVAALARGSS